MHRLVVLAVAAAVLGAASASASVPSPCTLIKTADATKALGVATGAGKSAKLGLYQACLYTAGAKGVVVLVRQISRSTFDKSATANPGPVVRLNGIGSDAYSVKGGAGLLLWKNGTEVTIAVSGLGKALPAEETLGKAAASRL
jgi:hypothetical protein